MDFSDISRFKRKTTASDITVSDSDFVYIDPDEDVYGTASDYFLGTISNEFNLSVEPTITETTVPVSWAHVTTVTAVTSADVVFSKNEDYLIATQGSNIATVFTGRSFIEDFDILDSTTGAIAVMDQEYLYFSAFSWRETTSVLYNSFKLTRFCRLSRKKYNIARFKIISATTMKIETSSGKYFLITIADTANDLSTMGNASEAGFVYLTPATYSQNVASMEVAFENSYGGGRLWVEVRDERGVVISGETVTVTRIASPSGADEAWSGDITITDSGSLATNTYGISRFDLTHAVTATAMGTHYARIQTGSLRKIIPLTRDYTAKQVE